MKTVISSSPEMTFHLGKKLGKFLKAGDLICLTGDLGAGKTAFSQGIGEGLEVTDYVTSPTYTIINEHRGRLPFYHFDVYRINDPDEMYELGYEEYFNGSGVCVVEWADIVRSIIPEDAMWVNLSYNGKEDQREICFDCKDLEEML